MSGARAVALAHHRDDAAETFLLMALRGSGVAGLGSMRMRASRPFNSDSECALLRPLLECSREDIEQFLTARGEAWRHDETNDSPQFRRSRIRNEVMPLLRSIEPAAARKLADSAALASEVADVVAECAARALPRIVRARSDAAILIATNALREEPAALHAEMLRQLWSELAARASSHPAAAPRTELLPPHSLLESLVRRVAQSEGDSGTFGPHAGVLAYVANRVALLVIEGTPHDEAVSSRWFRLSSSTE